MENEKWEWKAAWEKKKIEMRTEMKNEKWQGKCEKENGRTLKRWDWCVCLKEWRMKMHQSLQRKLQTMLFKKRIKHKAQQASSYYNKCQLNNS